MPQVLSHACRDSDVRRGKVQNGAKLDVRDQSTHGVLDSALVGNADREMIEYLSMKLG